MRILTVVGARPQFIKAAALSAAITRRPELGLSEMLVHTGQHHDVRMSDIFFSELGLPRPAHHLGVAGGTHGAMTGRMLERIEAVLLDERPDWVLIYGDTNSTLAGALAASKLHIPVAHVEAGLRSFNLRMPEEVNRIVADRLSTLLFCPTEAAIDNLRCEGVSRGVHQVGDVMYDVALHFADVAETRSAILAQLGLGRGDYVLATCHRAENTDDPARLRSILEGLAELARNRPVVLPLHPRTAKMVGEYGFGPVLEPVTVIDPVSYVDMVSLEKNAALIVTDSGGIQKEAFFYGVPCITTREETEWVETLAAGWNVLVGSDTGRLLDAASTLVARPAEKAHPYGRGDAADRILSVLAGTDPAARTPGA